MALDLRDTEKFPRTAIFTGNATTVVEIQLPVQASKVSVGSEVDIVYVYAIDGLADAGTPAGTDGYQFIPQNNLMALQIGRGSTRRSSIFVKFKSSGTGTICVIVEEQ